MKTKLISDNAMCVIADSDELEFASLSVNSTADRSRLLKIYTQNAQNLGLPSDCDKLQIEIYPFVNGGTVLIYTVKGRTFKKVQNEIFVRFENADCLLDCKNDISKFVRNIKYSALYRADDVYYVKIVCAENTKILKRFLCEYASPKCCQKQSFYDEYATEICTEIFT